MLRKGKEYLDLIIKQFQTIYQAQGENIEKASELIVDAIVADHALFAYGNVHSACVIADTYLRAGGFALLNQIQVPALDSPSFDPPRVWMGLERLEGYGSLIFDNTPAKAGDVLIVVSTSGRNAVPIEMAMCAKERGLKVIVITSMAYTLSMPSRHSSGKRLFEFGDVVIDDLAISGDAVLESELVPVRFCPTSGVVNTAIMQMLMAEVIERLAERGFKPPVFIAGNLDEFEDYQERLREELYKNQHRIFYTPF
jgi:uncharacterized phosphosugar-binding protein